MKHTFTISVLMSLFFTAFCFTKVQAQVQIAPVALYMSDDNRTGRIIVRNSSNEPQELSVELIFAYPASDEQGDVFLKTFETVPENAPSAAQWIRVYPRHLVLPPNQQQVIRFAARPPAGLPSGEYWVRPAISSTVVRDVEKKVTERISTSINLIKRTILSINYRNGDVSTGLAVKSLKSEIEGNSLHLLAGLERKGNAAYLGHARIRIFNAEGKLQQQMEKEIAVYRSEMRKFTVNISALASGTYRAELMFNTASRAEENKDILPAPPVSESVSFRIK